MADLQRAQRGKKVMADARALELDALRPPQASQELPEKVSGTLTEGGAAGLARVIGGAKKRGRPCKGGKPMPCRGGALIDPGLAGSGMTGAGPISDLNIPIISGLAGLFGLGKGKMKKQGRKAREDERLAMEVKGLKNKMKGGAYVDPEFGVINQPQGTAPELEQFATGSMRGGFLPLLAMAAAPLLGKLFGGMPKRYGKSQSMESSPVGSDEELEAIMKGFALGSPVRGLPAPKAVRATAAAAAAAPAAQSAEMAEAAREMLAPPAPRKRGRPARSPQAGVTMARQMLDPMALAAAADRIGLLPEPAGAFRAVQRSPPRYMGTPPTRPSSVEKKSGKMSGKKTSRSGDYMGSGMDRRKARAQVVKEVMKKHGLSLPMASKYVKEHNMY